MKKLALALATFTALAAVTPAQAFPEESSLLTIYSVGRAMRIAAVCQLPLDLPHAENIIRARSTLSHLTPDEAAQAQLYGMKSAQNDFLEKGRDQFCADWGNAVEVINSLN